MNTFKRNKVVMLPTNDKKASIYKHKEENSLSLNPVYKEWYKLPQHLYIISDDEIKKGDKVLQTRDNETTVETINDECEIAPDIQKKIIATTDASLTINIKVEGHTDGTNYYLPQPSQSFIQVFIEEYNKGNVITDVMVEYIIGQGYNNGQIESLREYLKINPKDNTITIRKIKDSWSKNDDDLKIAFEKFACAVYDENYKKDMSFKKRCEIMSKQWIKDNL